MWSDFKCAYVTLRHDEAESKHLEQLKHFDGRLSVQISCEEICHPYITVLTHSSRLPLSLSFSLYHCFCLFGLSFLLGSESETSYRC